MNEIASKAQPMTSDDLLRLIAQGEGQYLDFKEEAIKPGRLAETLVAFANADGGIVLIGERLWDMGRFMGRLANPRGQSGWTISARG